MSPTLAVYDACVLYPAPLRDLLVPLATEGLVHARWSDRIHDEWTRNLLANRPDLTAARVRRTRDLMNQHVRDSLVTGYESLIAQLALPDPDDCHVLAAALRARATLIVTFNSADFPHRLPGDARRSGGTSRRLRPTPVERQSSTCLLGSGQTT